MDGSCQDLLQQLLHATVHQYMILSKGSSQDQREPCSAVLGQMDPSAADLCRAWWKAYRDDLDASCQQDELLARYTRLATDQTLHPTLDADA